MWPSNAPSALSILGQRPGPPQALLAVVLPSAQYAPTSAMFTPTNVSLAPTRAYPSSPGPTSSWDQGSLVRAMNAMSLQVPNNSTWYMDYGASSHLTTDPGNLLFSRPNPPSSSSHVVVSDGSVLPIIAIGHLFPYLHTSSFSIQSFSFSTHYHKPCFCSQIYH